jgi:ABC-2 type transport system permease protein
MPTQIRAILWAQWRSFRNAMPGGARAGDVFGGLVALVWYGIWAGLGAAASISLAHATREMLAAALPWVLTAVFVYWQLAPVLTASLGASLDFKKLAVYPVPERQFFTIEVALRLTTAFEMLLVLTGILIGLLRNPLVPAWGPPVAVLAFIVFNLFLAAGLRSLLERLLAYRVLRELLVLALVLAAAVPQLLAYTGVPPWLRSAFGGGLPAAWPWPAAAAVALGDGPAMSAPLLAGWVAAAYLFGRRQFARGMRFDAAAAESAGRARGGRRWTALFYRLPRLLFADPLAALIEKELRSLSRSPRFRLVFLMGFTFGFVIWLPLFRSHGSSLALFPVIVSCYALLLMAEVVFWNMFGFDRSSAQLYFYAPIRVWMVLAAKSLAAAMFVFVEIGMVLAMSALTGIPLSPAVVLETYVVALVLSEYLLAAGNLSSLYYPRAVNPDHSWGRAARGRFQLILLFLFPLLALPVALAYAARYWLQSGTAFAGGLALAAALGALLYRASLASASRVAEERKEKVLSALADAAGPVVAH